MKSLTKKILSFLVLAVAFSVPAHAQHKVSLSWTPVTATTVGTTIPSQDITYKVYKAQCLVPFMNVQGAAINATCMFNGALTSTATTSAASYADQNVAAGNSYEYVVSALCEDTTSTVCLYPSESGFSNSVVATIAPAAPTGVGVKSAK